MTIFRFCQVDCRSFLFHVFVCLWPGKIGDLRRVVPCFSHLSTPAIRVAGRVACPVVVFVILSETWFSVLFIDLHG